MQFPGRGARVAEPACTRMEELVKTAAPGLLPHLRDKPFAFFGHSLGALVGFELARYLRRHFGLSPVRLIVSGHNAPQLPDPDVPIYNLPEAEFVQKLRALNGMSREVLDNAELMQFLIPIIRADFEICDTYVYLADQPLSCPISAFGGLRDRYLSREGLEAWRAQSSVSFSLRMFPGDHFYLNTDRLLLLQAVARELTQTAAENAAVSEKNL